MKTIEFPDHWQAPKYRLGQHVKQGQIVGMEYSQPGTKRSLRYGVGWEYWILINETEDYAETFTEALIEPLTAKDYKVEIDQRQNLVEMYQKDIAALVEQMQV